MAAQATTHNKNSGRGARLGGNGLRTVASGAVAAAAARGAYAALRRYPPAGAATWTRTNHRGEAVTLLEGPAVAAGAIMAQAAAAAVARRATGRRLAAPGHPERDRGSLAPSAIALAGAGALGFGIVDDLAGSGSRRGLRGHLGALAHGEVTTGTVKLAGLVATGLACAALPNRGRVPGQPPAAASAVDLIINAGLIAGGANLLNLFDLRPGRAIKVAALSGGLVATAGGTAGGAAGDGAGLALVAAPCGAALGLLPEDLRERAMLGDAGANALGAMLGAAAAASLPRPVRAGLLAGIAGLTLASEKVSFTKVIERTPALRWLDMLGRRPPGPAGLPAAGHGEASASAGPSSELALPAAAPPRRRRAGRHRRVGVRVGRMRSAERFREFLKKPARQEP